jgi:hypothetical protein
VRIYAVSFLQQPATTITPDHTVNPARGREAKGKKKKECEKERRK